MTENYYVLLQNPTKLNFSKLLFGYVPGVYMLSKQSPAHSTALWVTKLIYTSQLRGECQPEAHCLLHRSVQHC